MSSWGWGGQTAGGARGASGIVLRPLRSADFDRVLELERVLFGRGAWTYGMLADELAGLGRWYVVAEPDPDDAVGPQPVVGYAGLWFDGDVAQVMTIGVDPACQRQGVGRLLLEALIDRSRALRAEAVLLEVRVDNWAALAMYERFGFERLGVRKRYYQPEDKDAYTMRLPLRYEDEPVADAGPGVRPGGRPDGGAGGRAGDGADHQGRPDHETGDAA